MTDIDPIAVVVATIAAFLLERRLVRGVPVAASEASEHPARAAVRRCHASWPQTPCSASTKRSLRLLAHCVVPKLREEKRPASASPRERKEGSRAAGRGSAIGIESEPIHRAVHDYRSPRRGRSSATSP